MTDTGIVRRVDELGRVVIPKEIRKTLRLKTGEPLEIYTDKDLLIFKKYSPVETAVSFIEEVVKAYREICEKSVIVCDTDKVIYASGKEKTDVGNPITDETARIIDERKSVCLTKADGSKFYAVYKGENVGEIEGRIIVPIAKNGDAFGVIIATDRNKNCKCTTDEVKLLQLVAGVIAGRFE